MNRANVRLFLIDVRWAFLGLFIYTAAALLVLDTGLVVIHGVPRGTTWQAWLLIGPLLALFLGCSIAGFWLKGEES